MSSFNSSSYYFKDAEGPSTSRYVFDATKSNVQDRSIPEIDSTLYGTMRTGGNTFLVDLSGDIETQGRTSPIQAHGLGRAYAASLPELRRRSLSMERRWSSASGVKITSDSDSEEDQLVRNENVTGGRYNRGRRGSKSFKARRIRRPRRSRRPSSKGGRRSNARRLISSMPSQIPALQKGRMSIPILYDGTDSKGIRSVGTSTRSPYKYGPGKRRASAANISSCGPSRAQIPRMDQSSARAYLSGMTAGHDAAATVGERPQCLVQFPIMVVTKQFTKFAKETRILTFHAEIYFFSAKSDALPNFEELDIVFRGVTPLMSRRINKLRNNDEASPDSIMEEKIFAQNNIIKIERFISSYYLYQRERNTFYESRTFSNLCPAEMTDGLDEFRSHNPRSTLNVMLSFNEKESSDGRLQINERMVITLSDHTERTPTINMLQDVVFFQMHPNNVTNLLYYDENVKYGQRCVDITRYTTIEMERLSEQLQEPLNFRKTHIYTIHEIPGNEDSRGDGQQSEQSSPSGSRSGSELVTPPPILPSSPSSSASEGSHGTLVNAQARSPDSPSSSQGSQGTLVNAQARSPDSPSSSQGSQGTLVDAQAISPDSPSSSPGSHGKLVNAEAISPDSPSSPQGPHGNLVNAQPISTSESSSSSSQPYVIAKPVATNDAPHQVPQLQQRSTSPAEGQLGEQGEMRQIPGTGERGYEAVPVIQGVAADGTPIINNVARSPMTSSQQRIIADDTQGGPGGSGGPEGSGTPPSHQSPNQPHRSSSGGPNSDETQLSPGSATSSRGRFRE